MNDQKTDDLDGEYHGKKSDDGHDHVGDGSRGAVGEILRALVDPGAEQVGHGLVWSALFNGGFDVAQHDPVDGVVQSRIIYEIAFGLIAQQQARDDADEPTA